MSVTKIIVRQKFMDWHDDQCHKAWKIWTVILQMTNLIGHNITERDIMANLIDNIITERGIMATDLHFYRQLHAEMNDCIQQSLYSQEYTWRSYNFYLWHFYCLAR